MKLWHYIQGFRKGKEAHRIELESMKDPFLYDALDGYDRVKGNHKKRLEELQKRVRKKPRKKISYAIPLCVAAGILIILGIGSVFIIRENKPPVEQQIVYHDLQPEAPVVQPQPKEIAGKEKITARSEALKEAPLSVSDLSGYEISIGESGMISSEDQATVMKEEIIMPRISETQSRLDEIVAVSALGTINQPETTETSEAISPDKKDFDKYIKENLKYPADEECKGIKGKVKIAFYVNEQGRPYNITIKESLCPSADKEAIRLILDGPNWPPGTKDLTVDIKF